MQITVPRTVQALTQVMTDDYSRRILVATVSQAKSVEDLSRENNIPLSTCYRRVHDMMEGGVLIVQKIVITQDGKKYELYRSAFKGLSMTLDSGTVSMEATINEDMADKLYNVWSALKWQQGTR